jgi:hypothetical protein
MQPSGFEPTSLDFVHDTGPVPLGYEAACGALECRQGRGDVCKAGCIAAAKRVAQEEMSSAWSDSSHAALERTRSTQEPFAWLAAVTILGAVALVAHLIVAW